MVYGVWCAVCVCVCDHATCLHVLTLVFTLLLHPRYVYFQYFHFVSYLTPLGFFACCYNLSRQNSFLVAYTIISLYFSRKMIRLVIILSPAAAAVSGVAFTLLYDAFRIVASDGSSDHKEFTEMYEDVRKAEMEDHVRYGLLMDRGGGTAAASGTSKKKGGGGGGGGGDSRKKERNAMMKKQVARLEKASETIALKLKAGRAGEKHGSYSTMPVAWEASLRESRLEDASEAQSQADREAQRGGGGKGAKESNWQMMVVVMVACVAMSLTFFHHSYKMAGYLSEPQIMLRMPNKTDPKVRLRCTFDYARVLSAY